MSDSQPRGLYLNDTDIRAILSWPEAIDAARDAFASAARGTWLQQTRTELVGDHMVVATMPALDNSEHGQAAAKVVCVVPGNVSRGLPAHQGLCVLFDALTGQVRTLADAGTITEIRTAAASVVATQALARADVGSLGVLGTGHQALPHLRAFSAAGWSRVTIWGRDTARADAVAEQAAREGVEVAVGSSARETAKRSEVLLTLTSSAVAFVEPEWIRPGTHINAIGSSTLRHTELKPALVRRARVFVDDIEAAKRLAGDLTGLAGRQELLTLGDVLTGSTTGRRSVTEITLFKSVGIAAQDLALMSLLDTRARASGVGQALAL